MIADLSRCRAVIIVFAMDGCPYCDEFQPRLDHQLRAFRAHGTPFEYYDGGAITRGSIPVIVLDGASQDAQIQSIADQHKVSGMPTTILFTHNARPMKLEGALDDGQIYDLLVRAAHANR